MLIKPNLDRALRAVERRIAKLDEAKSQAESALTDLIEIQFLELVERFPKRRFHASSGMGSLSIEMDNGDPKQREYIWIWNSQFSPYHCPIWKGLAEAWEKQFDDFARVLDANYINFSRDVTVTGKNYRGV